MSIIPKIWNKLSFNFKNTISLVTSNIVKKIGLVETITQRLYSKRFTYCDNCNQCKKKLPQKCDKKSKKRTKRNKEEKKCVPFQETKPKKKTQLKAKKAARKCVPGMQNPCVDVTCRPNCALGKSSRRQWSTNECGRESPVRPCPRGDWERE